LGLRAPKEGKCLSLRLLTKKERSAESLVFP
jgi:hypothetical protein